MSGSGDITVWINSPGGDCVAAAQIYNLLMDYKGNVTVKIDGIAASAASVVAMAGTKVLVSPVSMLMIHNPMTVAMGNSEEMQKAIEMLAEVKESIINAYEIKTNMSRAKISHTLFAVSFDDGTTWWNYVDNAWAQLSEAQSGMTKAALANIGTDAWALKATTGHYKFRFVLTEGGYVNSIVVDYLN